MRGNAGRQQGCKRKNNEVFAPIRILIGKRRRASADAQESASTPISDQERTSCRNLVSRREFSCKSNP